MGRESFSSVSEQPLDQDPDDRIVLRRLEIWFSSSWAEASCDAVSRSPQVQALNDWTQFVIPKNPDVVLQLRVVGRSDTLEHQYAVQETVRNGVEPPSGVRAPEPRGYAGQSCECFPQRIQIGGF